jgi:hypothetical protein
MCFSQFRAFSLTPLHYKRILLFCISGFPSSVETIVLLQDTTGLPVQDRLA